MKNLLYLGAGLVVGVGLALLVLALQPHNNPQIQVVGANTYSRSAIASVALPNGAFTTTTLTNNDGVNRIVDDIKFYANATNGTSGTLKIAYSDNGLTPSGTLLSINNFTSTTQNWITTSTFATVSDRVWATGRSIIAYPLEANSTTAGVLVVHYYNE